MPAANKPQRRPRGALTSDAIVDAAVGIVAAGGLDALSMRAIARELDVPVTSVHWHFRTRDDLIDVITARMADEFYDSMPALSVDGDWASQLRAYFAALRDYLLRRSSFLELSFDRVGPLLKDARLRRRLTDRLESEVAVLARAGLPADDAYRLHSVCTNYVRGFVLLELAQARATRPASVEDQPFLDPITFPVMSQVTEPGGLSWRDADAQFELGLELLLHSIATRMPSRPV